MWVFQSVPMWRLTERMVRSALVTAWRLATSPTSTSPSLPNATTDGVVRAPSALGITTASPASRAETTELVVPRSIPTALGIWGSRFPFPAVWDVGGGLRADPGLIASTDLLVDDSGYRSV